MLFISDPVFYLSPKAFEDTSSYYKLEKLDRWNVERIENFFQGNGFNPEGIQVNMVKDGSYDPMISAYLILQIFATGKDYMERLTFLKKGTKIQTRQKDIFIINGKGHLLITSHMIP